MVLPHLGLGGGETAMMRVAEGLAERFELDVCALDRGAGPGSRDRPVDHDAALPGLGIRHELAARFDRVALPRRRFELRALLARTDAVLWYGVTNAVPRVLEKLAPRPISIRVVHTSRAVDGVRFHRRWRRLIDAAVCVVPAVARQLPAATFIANPCAGEHLRGTARTLFPASERKTLGFLGRLLPLKNVAWLIEHLDRLDCDLLLQGLDTELMSRAELARLAARHGVEDRVRFLPPGRDVGTLLRSIDALAVLSRHEGFPRVVVEAGLAGTPVVATPVGALPELFPSSILFVDQDAAGQPRIASLRAAIERVAPAWGARLRRRVAELCDPAAVTAAWEELILETWRRRAAA